ncbi:gas vesicle protein [Streptomyces ipomoeae]|uniref:Gas vesicle protein n=2 Tax=Streptomyces ipomoeae TaxID=103232 RepID=L1L344_9ACTN|nr:gas vesicle protein [Streptomyces ipomoeae]EKX67486.1 gas vesicle protein [Streptomyces ipomoeae 91-03]MDX2693753.1 gas vesicle protein [Streptomyces ipomoeae]MDX2819515.1 gas vesicle protein [Streptomyces ipomoeae]MDX2840781.1 gas vesicle protein [Streptomyces ipomoeae]MDX2875070.1 gas vesicle protein [Streptomyces ipomoeae]
MTTSSRLPEPYGRDGGSNLADILERVLDKGIIIAGDIRINLLDIELLTVKLRLIVASVDKAKEMGIDWWEDDPALSSRAHRNELSRENAELRERLARLEELEPGGPRPGAETDSDSDSAERKHRDRSSQPARPRPRHR